MVFSLRIWHGLIWARLHGSFASETESERVLGFQLQTGGSLGPEREQSFSGFDPGPLSQFTVFTTGVTKFLIAGSVAQAGLHVFEVGPGDDLIHRESVADHSKVTLEDVSDLLTIDVDGTPYLVTGSLGEGGISSFSIDLTGKTQLIDTVGVKDGMWLSGLSDLASVTADGTAYVVVGATNSSSLSLVRINPMGVLFVSDHINDTLGSRFANVSAVDAFTVNDRGFVVAGGSDDGLSLFEILPDGTFFMHQSIEQQNGWSIENVTAIQSAIVGNEVQVFAAGASTPGVTQFLLSTASISNPIIGDATDNTLIGGTGDDLIFGENGGDVLKGGNGDDILSGGADIDSLYGGAGADVFIFDSDTGQDQVMDFELLQDQLDLSRWGRVYDKSALTILSYADGAEIRFHDNSLRLFTADGGRLDADDFGADSFIF